MSEENVPKQVLARVIAVGKLLGAAQKADKKPVMSTPEPPRQKPPSQTPTPPTTLCQG
jgi:hypothetical protein